MSHWVEASEKNGRDKSPEKAVCWGLEHWLDQESLLGVSVYGFLAALEIRLWLYCDHAFFQTNYFYQHCQSYPLLLSWNNFLQNDWVEVHDTWNSKAVCFARSFLRFFNVMQLMQVECLLNDVIVHNLKDMVIHNLKEGLLSTHQKRMLCFLFLPLLYLTFLKYTIIEPWCHLASHQYGTTDIKKIWKK